ncbi:unnamed protein product, partial [Iphiclides podalirius]
MRRHASPADRDALAQQPRGRPLTRPGRTDDADGLKTGVHSRQGRTYGRAGLTTRTDLRDGRTHDRE